MSQSFPPSPIQEEVFFASTDGLQMEGKLFVGEQPWGAILCHPHPQHGGTMHNKVIDAAMRAVASMGGSALRFNYRGVGRSEGSYGEGVGEVHDLKGAIQRLADEGLTEGGLLLIGFSFGTSVIGRLLSTTSHGADGVVLLAPPLANFQVPTFPAPGDWGLHMLLGEFDQFCTPALLQRYAEEFSPTPVRTRVVSQADHFFHGYLHEVVSFLRSVME